MPLEVTLAVEGRVDEAVGRRLLKDAGLITAAVYGRNGKDYLDSKIAGYNSAARFSNWLVLRDLNSDACAPALLSRLLPAPSARMRLNIAIRAIESWLMADRKALAALLRVRTADVPQDPETVIDPKARMVDVARKSKKREIRDGIAPAAGSTSKVGPGYVAILGEFAATTWSPTIAAAHAPSLERLIRHLNGLAGRSGAPGV